MGTESSAFFGLNPEKGSTVIYPRKTDYKYFTYTPDGFLNGNIRNFKNSWKVNNENGSSYLKEIFKETLNKSNEITVLLSPAASSFDQFLNFESRGNAFKSLISEIWEL